MVGGMSPPDSSPLAIACSLTTAEMQARLREIATIGDVALLDSQLDTGCAILRFSASAGNRQRLAAIVEAESRCCGFMTFDLDDEGPELVLRIETPAEAQPALEQFAASFAPETVGA
jgi:hypothetical protein